MSAVSRIPPFLIAALVVTAALLWGIHLAVDPEPLSADAAAVVALSLGVLSLIADAGLLITRGEWSRRLAAGSVAVMLGLATATPLDGGVVAGIIASAAAGAGLAGPWLAPRMRIRPSAAGPAPRATAAIVTALAAPTAVALANPGGLDPAAWASIATAAGGAWTLAAGRGLGLWILRLLLPAAGTAALLVDPLPSGLLTAATCAVPAALAWSFGLPGPIEASRFPIPPELAPADVLRSAGYDEAGLPRGERP
jgi:hypothetical protein